MELKKSFYETPKLNNTFHFPGGRSKIEVNSILTKMEVFVKSSGTSIKLKTSGGGVTAFSTEV